LSLGVSLPCHPTGRRDELRGDRRGALSGRRYDPHLASAVSRGGIEGLAGFGHEGSACRLSGVQQDKLTAWITETLPRTTREVGAWIETEGGITYESRSGLIALLHRLGMEHRKPKAVSSKRNFATNFCQAIEVG
jgi:Winged helix-turn helix